MARGTLIVLGAALIIGCGSDVGNEGYVVGGPCEENADCASGSECATGGDFPGGTCTVRCADDGDCPSGTACIDEMNGVCLLLCNFDTDCRLGYECGDKKRAGHSGSATVCTDD